MLCFTPIIGTISSISQSQLKSTKTYYNRHLPALDCILTSTDTPQSLHAYGVHLGVYAIRSYGDTPPVKDGARQVDTAKPKDKPYKLSDGGGLYLLVNPNGKRYWRLS